MKCQATELEIETIVNRIENGDMDLQPDFQRGEIWPPQKKKKLIDSILRGWRIPPIHVVPNAKDVDEVLDGQQRLAAIRDFYGNKFPIDGNIEPKDEVIVALDGCYYENLSPEWQRRFKKYSINLIRLTEYKPAEPAELFYRLNQPSSLTSAEQRNAYLGITRDQIKSLANAFTSYGATPELIGFSNSRLAYDEIISKFCYVVESETLKKKVTSIEISEKYRKGIPFSDECVEIVGETLIKFMDCIKHVDDFKFYFNKASIFSWFVFVRQNLCMDNEDLKKVILNFEFCRAHIKGKTSKEDETYILTYENLQNTLPFFDIMLTVFNQRASVGSTDALAIIYRDITINLFKDAILGTKSELLGYAMDTFLEKKNLNYVLDDIIAKYKWGEEYV